MWFQIFFYSKGADKLGISNTVNMLVLEQDGTEIDSDSFEYTDEKATFIILTSSQTWKSCEGLYSFEYYVDDN